VKKRYLLNRMLLYKSIMVSKSVATAEHKCSSECPLMIYRFALYILLSASPSILAIVYAAVAQSQNLECVYLGGNKTAMTGITRHGINWNVMHNRRSLNTLPSTKTHIISIRNLTKTMNIYVYRGGNAFLVLMLPGVSNTET
jgi:hypothetical protein